MELDAEIGAMTAAFATRHFLDQAVIWTASHDPLRDMGAACAGRLIAAGNDVDCRCLPGMVHNVLGHAGVSTAAARAPGALGNLLRTRLGL